MSESPKTSSKASTPGVSAGILLYRQAPEGLRVLLAHPGGPFFQKKDEGAWSIPKGLVETAEQPEAAARREFAEELGWAPKGGLQSLGEVKLRSGKRVAAFALESHEDEQAMLDRFSPGTFTMEWPPRSGRTEAFPEVDRVQFFSLSEARTKLSPAQAPLLDRLKSSVET